MNRRTPWTRRDARAPVGADGSGHGGEGYFWDHVDLVGAYFSDTGVTVATGVSSWGDQSGNGRHLVQATGTKQPAWAASGGPNSTPSLEFDGGAGDDDALSYAAYTGNIGTVFAVISANVATFSGYEGIVTEISDGETWILLRDATTLVYTGGNPAPTTYMDGTLTNDFGDPRDWTIVEVTSTPTATNGILVGWDRSVASTTFDGAIAAILIYSSTLSASARTKIRTGLSSKYAITVA